MALGEGRPGAGGASMDSRSGSSTGDSSRGSAVAVAIATLCSSCSVEEQRAREVASMMVMAASQ